MRLRRVTYAERCNKKKKQNVKLIQIVNPNVISIAKMIIYVIKF